MRYKRKEKLWARKFYRNGEDWDSIRLYPWNWSRKWKPKKCPYCGKRLYTNSWNDDLGVVEQIEECLSCNYKNHWSYGRFYLSIGSWDWEGNEILDSVSDEFKLQISLYKNKKSRLIQLYWKKKKRQRKRGGRR
ncbi:hypothetical protein ABE354_04815 [Brevibacillus laterosporus]|uniref:hypothetical protein n=1 Tax=Brevibacillus laterosporus TaxID=1465 RepID=UPI003D1D1020